MTPNGVATGGTRDVTLGEIVADISASGSQRHGRRTKDPTASAVWSVKSRSTTFAVLSS